MANPSKNVDADGTDSAGSASLSAKLNLHNPFTIITSGLPFHRIRQYSEKWIPLDAGMKLTWDSTSDISKDDYEKGMDFLGYRLYRAPGEAISILLM